MYVSVNALVVVVSISKVRIYFMSQVRDSRLLRVKMNRRQTSQTLEC